MGKVQLLKSSAGSGKTYRLAYEYVSNVIEDPYRYRNILAVTFTNKATEEMKQRIISEIHTLASERQSNYMENLRRDLHISEAEIVRRAQRAQSLILHDYSHFSVLTIDKFFQRIIRSFIKELGIDLNFNLELQTDTLLSGSSNELIESISTDEELREWITGFLEEKIAENRSWDLKRELTELGREVFKEDFRIKEVEKLSKDVLIEHVRRSEAEYQKVLTTMRQTARKALDIIASNSLSDEDFYYGRNGFITYFGKVARGEFTVYGARVSSALVPESEWGAKKSPNYELANSLAPQLRPLLAKLCEIYDANIRMVNSNLLLRKNYRNFAMLSDLAKIITRICGEKNIMPISETNHILHRLVAGNEAPFIFEKMGNHFSHYMIDEFQDTSTLQWSNFIPLLHNTLSQNEKSPVFLVGDVKQSIYRWRGGDWQILANGVELEFRDVENEKLTTNYRSTRNIVEFNNSIVESCVETDNSMLNDMLAEAAANGAISTQYRDRLTDMLRCAYEDHAQTPDKSEPKGYIKIIEHGEPLPDHKPYIITQVEELQERGYSPGDIAVLVRYKREGAEIARTLLDYKIENPNSPYSYDVVTAEALRIGDSPAVAFIEAVMRLTIDPLDRLMSVIYNRWLNRKLDEELPEEELQFFRALGLLSPEEVFENILIRYKLGEESSHVAHIQAMHELVIAYCTSNIADTPLFLKWWEESGINQSINIPNSTSAITIITVHKAKGLEYKVVIIPYCTWRLTPKNESIIWSETAGTPYSELKRLPIGVNDAMSNSYFSEEYYEELILSHIDNINTFYVAATRARQELIIMMPRRKGNGKQTDHHKQINTLVSQSIGISENTAAIGTKERNDRAVKNIVGRVSEHNEDLIIEFGEPMREHAGEESEVIIPRHYPSRSPDAKVRLHQRLLRYYSDEEDIAPTLSPRNYGILMHKLFEEAHTMEDIEKTLKSMRYNGAVSDEEEKALRTLCDQVMSNETVHEWFSGEWDSIRTENDIILPSISEIRRPDRVMTRGDYAVVVDYKFGERENRSYRRQTREYMELLSKMGYSKVEGYLWYVSLNKIEKVG